jgi:hypothetical protein
LETERLKNAKKEFEIVKELFENRGREADVIKVKELLANLEDKFAELKTSYEGTLTAHTTSA